MRGRFSSTSTGTRYPDFTNVAVQDFHDVVSAKFGGGKIMFSGYEANGRHFPLGIAQNNVVFDGTQPTFEKGAATHDTPGPGAVSFSGSIVTSSANDVTVIGTPGTSTPYDCSAAFTTLKSVAPASPIPPACAPRRRWRGAPAARSACSPSNGPVTLSAARHSRYRQRGCGSVSMRMFNLPGTFAIYGFA